MDLCQLGLERLEMNNDSCDDGAEISDNDTTIGATSRPLSVRSNPFDEELPVDFTPRSLDWFMKPRPDSKKPLSMFWTDRESYYAIPSAESLVAERSDGVDEHKQVKLGTMGSLEEWFVPRKEGNNMNTRKWTIGAPFPSLPFRRVSVHADDLSLFKLARPPTPPRKRSCYPEIMSNKPLPPLPSSRRFVSAGSQPLIRSQSTPGHFTSSLSHAPQSVSSSDEDIATIVDAYERPTVPTTEVEQPTMNGETSRATDHGNASGPHLLVRLHSYRDEQMDAIAQMETTLSNPQVRQSLRQKFLGWSQQLIDLDCPFRINLNPSFIEEVKITEKDAHSIVDWAIEVGTKMSGMHDQIIECINAAEYVQFELRDIAAKVKDYHGSLLPAEELYHQMADVVRKKCRSPRLHEVLLLKGFLNLFEHLLYNPFKNVKEHLVVVHDEYPHNAVAVALNIETPLTLLKRVLNAAYVSHGEYSTLTKDIREEFFMPIEQRIPGISSRTDGYLNNVVGPSNVI